MYFQQAVLREFLRLLKSSPYRRFIDIQDQSRNRELALYGSYTGEIDTIDLSAASDSVSLRLVKEIFPPSWLIPMLVTRSNKACLPDRTTVLLEKFAPMGSALCFPTQCIIFATVCILASLQYTYDRTPSTVSFSDWISEKRIKGAVRSFSDSPRYRLVGFQPLAVYGDDICVDQKLTPYVTSILSRLGFQVNLEKSFRGGQGFRESCGGYYLCGSNVTPLYFSVEKVSQKLTAGRVASQVHMINEAWNRGYKTLYRFLRSNIMTGYLDKRLRSRLGGSSIPYVPVGSPHFGIYANKWHNNHLLRRTNRGFQRDELKVWTISYDWTQEPGDLLPVVDAYEYMRWWAGRSDYPTDFNTSVSRSDRGGARLKWRWIPLP